MTKRWYTSKTLWFNLLTLLIALASQFFGFADFVPEGDVSEAIVGVIAFINLGLRLLTTRRVTT